MESIKELATALSKAQSQIEGAKKDVTNTFFKAKYADLSSVVEAIRKPLADNGLSYVQIAHDKEGAAAIETLILHSSGESLSCGTVSVPVAKADAQGFGSAMTYARRYSLSAAFGVAPEDDDGNAATKAKPDPVKAALKTEFPNGESPGKLVEQEAASDGLPIETVANIRIEAKAIEGDFYTLSAKQALSRWTSFKKDTDEQEQRFCWSLLDSKVRSGIKKIGETVAA